MEKKKIIVYPIVFDALGKVLLQNDELISIDISNSLVNNEPDISYVQSTISDILQQPIMLGDVLLNDVSDNGDWIWVFMTFVEKPELFNSWSYLQDIDTDFARSLQMHLNNTLYNANAMRVGYCYENTKTNEGICIIHAIDDRVKNKKFFVIESTMCEEPMILPSDAYWGVPMKWVPHVRFIELAKQVPQTLAEKAKHFFISAHNITNHRYDNKPYSYHLSGVVDEFHTYKHLIPETDWDHVEAELWGHDGIEDARLTWNDIKEPLGPVVAEGCYALTNEKGRNRSQRANSNYYANLAEDEFGEFKKLCDRLANVRQSVSNGHKMGDGYKKELVSFEAKLRQGARYVEMWNDLKTMLNA